MRQILAASLLLVPSLFPAAAVASKPMNDDASAPTITRPLSTGVISPRILHSANILVSPDQAATLPQDATVVLKLNIDEQGKPQGIQVVRSINRIVDARVIDAVNQFRWSPATLNKQVIPIDMTLNVIVQH